VVEVVVVEVVEEEAKRCDKSVEMLTMAAHPHKSNVSTFIQLSVDDEYEYV